MVFSSEYCKIFKFFYRAPPVAASASAFSLTDVSQIDGNKTFLSQAKGSQLNNENQQVLGTGSREDKEHCHDIIDEKGKCRECKWNQ